MLYNSIMIHKISNWLGVAVMIVILFSGDNVLAAPLSGNSTSTYVGVYSGLDTLAGYPNFVFVNSTKRLGLLTSSPLSALNIAGDPPQSSTSTFLLFGSNFIIGGSANGTYLGANPSTFSGDFVNFQIASSSKLRVDSSGNLTASGLTVTGLNYGVMVVSGTTQVTTVAPGTSGNVLVSNGSAWTSVAPSASIVTPFTFGEDVGTGEAVYISDGMTAAASKTFQVDTGGTLTTNLQAYYKLEDATDFFGSNNLTNTGSVTFNAGQVNNAADFGTNNSTKDLETTNSLGINGGNMSMSFWLNISTAPGTNITYVVAEQANTGTQVEYIVHYLDNAGTKQMKWIRGRHGIANDILTVNTTLTVGTWYHIVLTYDGTNVEGWINNVSQGTVASSGNGSAGSTTGFGLGFQYVGGGAFTSGLIDEVGVWGKKLSNTEIADLYNSGSGQTMVPSHPGNGVVGRVYRASATNNVYSDGFIGFSAATTTAGNPGNVIIGGLATNVSTALSTGKQYYLGNSSGTLRTTPGTVARKVGIAVTTTTLDITNTW